MRVSSYSFTEDVYQLYKKNQSSGVQKTTFDDLLKAAAGDVQNAEDPKLQLWADYQAWKSQQPPRQLPDSKGATEENLAYLLENFTGDEKTGELSLFQRMEMIDTMREMGIITEEQMKDCLGIGTSCLATFDPKRDSPVVVTGLAGDRNMETWSSFFTGLPLMKAFDRDDMFEVLFQQLRFTRAGDLAAEIREVLDRVRQEVCV